MVSARQAGNYVLSFAAAQRANYRHGGRNFQIPIDGIVVGISTPTGAAYTTNPFTVSPGVHTIASRASTAWGGQHRVHDNVQIIPA